MSKNDVCIRSDKDQILYCRNHDMHTHPYVAKVQFGAEIWARAEAKKKNKDASGAATRRRVIFRIGQPRNWGD